MKQLKISLLFFLIMSLLLGIIYPLALTGMAQLAFNKKANGSLITVNNRLYGSELIGQKFTSQKYFHSRPSSNDYDGLNSGGSNLGPTNGKFFDQTEKLAEKIRKENFLKPDAKIPADLVFASGSGLDPHISIDAALLQAERIARERKVDISIIKSMIKRSSNKFYWGIFGNSYVNVLKLNILLDNMDKKI